MDAKFIGAALTYGILLGGGILCVWLGSGTFRKPPFLELDEAYRRERKRLRSGGIVIIIVSIALLLNEIVELAFRKRVF